MLLGHRSDDLLRFEVEVLDGSLHSAEADYVGTLVDEANGSDVPQVLVQCDAIQCFDRQHLQIETAGIDDLAVLLLYYQ